MIGKKQPSSKLGGGVRTNTPRKSPFGIKKQLLAVPIILSIVLVASAGMVLAQQQQTLQISEDGILTSDYFQFTIDDRVSALFIPGIQFDPVPSSIVLETTDTDFVYSVFVGDRSVAFTTDSDFDLTILDTGNTIPKYYESDPADLVDIPKCTVDDTVTCYVLYTQYVDPRISISATQSGNYVLVSDGTPEPTPEPEPMPESDPAPEESAEVPAETPEGPSGQNETPTTANSCIPGLPDDGLRFGANVNSPIALVQRYLDLDPDCTYVSSSIDADLVNAGFVDDTDTLGSQLIAGFYHPTVLNGTTTFTGTYTVIFDKDGSTSEDIDISFTVVAPIIVALPEPVVVPPTEETPTEPEPSTETPSRLILIVSHTDENTNSQDAVATQYAVPVPPGYTLEDVTVDAGLGEAGVFASIVTESTRTDSDGNPVIDTVTDSNGNPIIEFKSSPREFDRTARGTVLLDYVNTSTSEGVTYALPTTAHIIEGISDPVLPNLVISASGGDAADPRLTTISQDGDGDDFVDDLGPNPDACINRVDDDGNADVDPNCELAEPDPKYLCDESDIYAPEPIDDVIREEEIIRECDTINLGDDTREGDYIQRQPKLVVIEGLADYTCNEATRFAGLSDARVQVTYNGTNTDGNHLVEFTAPYRAFPDVIEGVVKLNCSIDNAVISSFTLPVTINVNPTYDVLPFQGTLDPVSSGGSDDTTLVSPFPDSGTGIALIPGVTCQIPAIDSNGMEFINGTGPACVGVMTCGTSQNPGITLSGTCVLLN